VIKITELANIPFTLVMRNVKKKQKSGMPHPIYTFDVYLGYDKILSNVYVVCDNLNEAIVEIKKVIKKRLRKKGSNSLFE